MADYRYSARDGVGKLSRGTLRAEDREDLYRKLRGEGLYCIGAEELTDREARANQHRLRRKEIAFFCRQMSTMLSAGLPVLRALEILYEQAGQATVKKVYLGLYETIQKGQSLAHALRDQGEAFPPLLYNMVQAGEHSGTLDRVMENMAEHYEKENKLMNKVQASLTYPAILLAVAVTVIIGLFVFILPQFFAMFEGEPLPAITRGVMAVSHFLTRRWYLLLLGVLLTVLAASLLLGRPQVRLWVDRQKISLPVLGRLLRTIYISRFTSALSSLYSNGVPVLEAVEISVRTLDNRYLSVQFRQVLSDMERGELLSAAIQRTGLFDTMVTSVLHVGEESGSLGRMLAKLSDFYDDAAQTAMQKMVTLLEPCMLLFLAVLIGVVVAAVLLPVYGMYGSVL